MPRCEPGFPAAPSQPLENTAHGDTDPEGSPLCQTRPATRHQTAPPCAPSPDGASSRGNRLAPDGTTDRRTFSAKRTTSPGGTNPGRSAGSSEGSGALWSKAQNHQNSVMHTRVPITATGFRMAASHHRCSLHTRASTNIPLDFLVYYVCKSFEKLYCGIMKERGEFLLEY